jgi:hypothetical protein
LSAGERPTALAEFKVARPELEARFAVAKGHVDRLKTYFYGDTGYERGAGDPDLYKYFCQRYRALIRPGGSLAVVLPRSAFSAKGSTDFRVWLFSSTTVERLDFLLNNRRWMFDTHPQYTVALLQASIGSAVALDTVEVAGVAAAESEFVVQSREPGIRVALNALGPLREVPLVSNQPEADLLGQLRVGTAFVYGGGRWRCFPTRELHETDDKELWEGATSGRPLWKGESFDQFDPHGHEARFCPETDDVIARARRSRPGAESTLARELSLTVRRAAAESEASHARVVFRDVTNRTNSRTVLAALAPSTTFLLNSAPYLVFVQGTDLDRACCLGLMNSVPFDWQARRYVETHVSYFILEGLRFPALDDDAYAAIATAAARLSCPDERFAAFAEATGVEVGPLHPEERDALRAEIDALVARAWDLDADDLETIFADFTLDAVPEPYRQSVRDRFAELQRG